MALLTINNTDVVEAEIVSPRIGVWLAEVAINSTDASSFAAGTKATLTADSGLSLKGTITSFSDIYLNVIKLRVEGGNAGLSKLVSPAHYSNTKFSDILSAILNTAGETQNSNIDASLLSTQIPAWTLIQMTAGNALRALLEIVAPSLSWRILSDGTLWIGSEKWDAVDSKYDYAILETKPNEKMSVLAVDTPLVLAGNNLDGVGNIDRAEHYIKPHRVRTHVWVAS